MVHPPQTQNFRHSPITILPWTSRFDVSGLGSDGGDPIPEGLGDELRAVV